MTDQTTKIENKSLELLLKELKEIKSYLRKLLVIIPEESLEEYRNASEIRKAYLKSIKALPPK